MPLKNRTEREQFLENYKSWEFWKEIPELELKFYRYTFPTGTVIIATEYACIRWADYDNVNHRHIHKKGVDVNYHLILSESETFKKQYSETAYKFYNPSGDGRSSIIEYLTKTNPEIVLCQAE